MRKEYKDSEEHEIQSQKSKEESKIIDKEEEINGILEKKDEEESKKKQLKNSNKNKEFPDVFVEEGGFYDVNGFYILYDGSFWNNEKIFFNKDGFDSYSGQYDENLQYIPGPDWNEELQCYNSEIHIEALTNEIKELLISNNQDKLSEEYYQNLEELHEKLHPGILDVDIENTIKKEDDEDLNDNELIQEWIKSGLIKKQ